MQHRERFEEKARRCEREAEQLTRKVMRLWRAAAEARAQAGRSPSYESALEDAEEAYMAKRALRCLQSRGKHREDGWVYVSDLYGKLCQVKSRSLLDDALWGLCLDGKVELDGTPGQRAARVRLLGAPD